MSLQYPRPMKPVLWISAGLMAGLSAALIASESSPLSPLGSEAFWSIRCRESRGVEFTYGSPLQRHVGVDAFRTEVRSASVSLDGAGKVTIEGLTYGLLCQREHEDSPYHWRPVSLRGNAGVRILLRSGSPFPDANFQIAFQDDYSFRLEVPAAEFFNRKDLARLRAGAGLDSRTFAIQFQVLDRDGLALINLKHPFMEYRYGISARDSEESDSGRSLLHFQRQ